MLVLAISKGGWLDEDCSLNGYHRIALRALFKLIIKKCMITSIELSFKMGIIFAVLIQSMRNRNNNKVLFST